MTALARRNDDREQIDAIILAINAIDEAALDRLDAWLALADLSSRTLFESVDGDPDSVVIEPSGAFEAVATIYVTLVYGPSRDEESMSDEYVATVRGHLSASGVAIETVVVDTTSFYE